MKVCSVTREQLKKMVDIWQVGYCLNGEGRSSIMKYAEKLINAGVGNRACKL